MQWTDALERAAAEGKAMPDGLTGPEKQLYIAMRGLYYQYRVGIVDREQAKREKAELIKDFNAARTREQAYERSIKAWRWVDLNLNKCECEECKALKRAILQLENVML